MWLAGLMKPSPGDDETTIETSVMMKAVDGRLADAADQQQREHRDDETRHVHEPAVTAPLASRSSSKGECDQA
jgi:hypothetical protein